MSKTFTDLGLPHELVSPLRKAGITEPFPIQAATIPDALAGRDILGRAPTGSGKTLAFGLPLLATVKKAKSKRPRSLILSPTRELAEQIRKELAPVAAGRGLRLVTVYGGVAYHPQQSKLRKGVEVLIACPGRLLDLIEQGDLTLEDAEYVVVDEADRMADMGFMPQVRKLLDMTPSRRQTVLFSATLDRDVAELTRHYQTDPIKHETGTDGFDSGDAKHHFWRVEHANRLDLVASVVHGHSSTLVFTRTRRGADRLARQLHKNGVEAEAIHGGRSQRQRDRALRNFKSGKAEALIATDVAARGIHVDGVACVIHFDPPEDHKAYLHRSGRTARAGAEGHVVSLIQHDQVKSNYRLQRKLGLSGALGKPSLEALFDNGGETLGNPSETKEEPRRNGDGQRRSKPKSNSGQRRSRNGSNGNGSSRNSSRRNSSSQRRNGKPGASNNGNRKSSGQKAGSANGSSRSGGAKASRAGGDDRRRKPGSPQGRHQSGGSSRGNSGQQRRRKPSGTRAGR